MKIEQFIAKSEGEWRSMRTAHTLAFKQFEHIINIITIQILEKNDPKVLSLRDLNKDVKGNYLSPFQIDWSTEDEWETEQSNQITSGSTILIPIPKTNTSGLLIRSMGYAEPIRSLSNYDFSNNGTLMLTTQYKNSIAEERIWFLSTNVRCRSSVVYTSKNSGILQTSFASEVKIKV